MYSRCWQGILAAFFEGNWHRLRDLTGAITVPIVLSDFGAVIALQENVPKIKSSVQFSVSKGTVSDYL